MEHSYVGAGSRLPAMFPVKPGQVGRLSSYLAMVRVALLLVEHDGAAHFECFQVCWTAVVGQPVAAGPDGGQSRGPVVREGLDHPAGSQSDSPVGQLIGHGVRVSLPPGL